MGLHETYRKVMRVLDRLLPGLAAVWFGCSLAWLLSVLAALYLGCCLAWLLPVLAAACLCCSLAGLLSVLAAACLACCLSWLLPVCKSFATRFRSICRQNVRSTIVIEPRLIL